MYLAYFESQRLNSIVVGPIISVVLAQVDVPWGGQERPVPLQACILCVGELSTKSQRVRLQRIVFLQRVLVASFVNHCRLLFCS